MFDFVYIFSMQSRGLSLCLGMMCHSLSRSGHAAVNKLAENLYTEWIAVFESGVSYIVQAKNIIKEQGTRKEG